ncbi:unnamed protein product [Orchesella dallaii]|uniref:MACPF domain-containing protein n=1 Tax=Orchesella dallaii TaxID=48710 RepID=A0ABP1RW04_9HEXA
MTEYISKMSRIKYKAWFFAQVVVTLISLIPVSYSFQNPYQSKKCGEIFSEDGFSGAKLELADQEYSPNLADNYQLINGWSKTSSLRGKSGCVMNLCNDTYFDGECKTLTDGSYGTSQLSSSIGFTIASVGCACKKECKCSDIYMRKSSCARAYLSEGCNTCNTYYTDLANTPDLFPEDFQGKVKSLTLRKGCELTLYPEEDYQGDPRNITNEIVENYTTEFLSYECKCNNLSFTPRPPPPRPSNFLPLVDIPPTIKEILNMLGDPKYAKHEGLKASVKSWQKKRSQRNAYILLFGSTGSGKSSTINLLFDNPTVTKTGHPLSTTTHIQEYKVTLPIDELGLANTELRIIDTTSLGDTRGVQQDAKSLATLDEFLLTHEELKDRIPNAVLVFHKFTDNRFAGEGSRYVRMLRGLDAFQNQEYYPRNLFEQLESITKNGEDPIGLGVFRAAFRDSQEFEVSKSTFNLTDNYGEKFQHYLRVVANVYMYINKTEVSQILEQIWEDEVPGELKKKYTDSLQYFQNALHMRHITTKEDLPKTTTEILELFTSVKHDPVTIMMLEKAFGIKLPIFPQNSIAGYGYNILTDSPLSESPFEIGELQESDIGFMIPSFLTCKLEQNSTHNFIFVDDQQSYIRKRLRSIGIEGQISPTLFKGTPKPGYNVKTITFRNGESVLSAQRAFKRFQFIVKERPNLKKEFVEAVKALPTFNENDHEAVSNWTDFFNLYGTHVVKSIYGGGAIEIQLRNYGTRNKEASKALFSLIMFAENMPLFLGDNEALLDGNRTLLKEGIDHSLVFSGGNPKYQASDFSKLSIQVAVNMTSNWLKSLKYVPALLPSDIELIPISRVAKRIDSRYEAEIERAAATLIHNATLNCAPHLAP